MPKYLHLCALVLVTALVNDASAQHRIFGRLNGEGAVLFDPSHTTRYEVAMELGDSTVIDTIKISNFGGPYYLIATGNKRGRPLVVAYDLAIDSYGSLYRPQKIQDAFANPFATESNLGLGIRHICTGSSCDSCSFRVNKHGVITGCANGMKKRKPGQGWCEHSVMDNRGR